MVALETLNPHDRAARQELMHLLRASRAPLLRTMRAFAEAEIIIPTGPFAGRRFRVDRQPFAGLWLHEVDYGDWQMVVTTGPQQSGKTLLAFVLPTLYHLFEHQETVIVGLPDMDMADDKWRRDILPVLSRTRYVDLLPTEGEGSRRGSVKNAVTFKNGATLKFMSAGGGDKSRAAFNARVIVVTEANAFGASSETSEEADKFNQIWGRSRSFGRQRRGYIECTQETEAALIWQKYCAGTASHLVVPCPHCREFVDPDRPQLQGWQHAENVIEAAELAYFECPACGGRITDSQRREMNQQARLLHRGQSIDSRGKLAGSRPKTDVLGFRWTAFHNQFYTVGDIAKEEWQGQREIDEDNAERALCQFLWGHPYHPPHHDAVELHANQLIHRIERLPQGQLPDWLQCVTVGVDLGKWLGHYVVIAWTEGFTGHVVDYGRFDVPSASMSEEQAILTALREFRDGYLAVGWPFRGGRRLAEQVWIDSGYKASTVYDFIRETEGKDPKRFRPIKGWGAGQLRGQHYAAPKGRSKTITAVGDGYHFTRENELYITRVDIDANQWKSAFHNRLATKLREDDETKPNHGQRMPGSLSLFDKPPREHTAIAKHWTAEKQVLEYIPGKGERLVWERLRQQNHWFDASYVATAAAHYCGIRAVELPPRRPVPPPANPSPQLLTPDGRPFSVLERE